jgi:hypothetical protein
MVEAHHFGAQHRGTLFPYLTQSIVQDFREAVGASLYDEAKDDPTLVPIGCLIHIDAIFWYTFFVETGWCELDGGGNPVRMLYPDYKAARMRASIYRRELGDYLKKQLVGEVFPQELPPVAPSVPFYTNARTSERSL